MLGFVKVSEICSSAIHSLILFACKSGTILITLQSIAAALNTFKAHLAKRRQKLAAVRLVKSAKGSKGGFALTKVQIEYLSLQTCESIEGHLCSLNKSIIFV